MAARALALYRLVAVAVGVREHELLSPRSPGTPMVRTPTRVLEALGQATSRKRFRMSQGAARARARMYYHPRSPADSEAFSPSRQAEIRLIETMTNTSQSSDFEESVGDLLRYLESLEPPQANFDRMLLVGHWRLEYATGYPAAIVKDLSRRAAAFEDLSIDMMISTAGTLEYSMNLSMSNAELSHQTLHLKMRQRDRTPCFTTFERGGIPGASLGVTYVSDALLIMREISGEHLTSPGSFRKEVWRRLDQPLESARHQRHSDPVPFTPLVDATTPTAPQKTPGGRRQEATVSPMQIARLGLFVKGSFAVLLAILMSLLLAALVALNRNPSATPATSR